MRPGITLTAGELAGIVGGELTGAVAAGEPITLGPQGVVIHSALVEPGAVFVAQRGGVASERHRRVGERKRKSPFSTRQRAGARVPQGGESISLARRKIA